MCYNVKIKGGNMKEYSIYCIYYGAKPFYLSTFNSFMEAKLKLYDMINLEMQRNRPYYVDNEFFDNIFPPTLNNIKYFCIKERTVSTWEKTTEGSKKNNILFFNKKA